MEKYKEKKFRIMGNKKLFILFGGFFYNYKVFCLFNKGYYFYLYLCLFFFCCKMKKFFDFIIFVRDYMFFLFY